jgi:hypothetical protein
MNGLELGAALSKAGVIGGWVIRDAKIVLWENTQPIPAEFAEYVELDEPLNLETTQE